MSLLESCDQYFGTRNLYEVLSVNRTANNAELGKGYKKVSLKVHPDRVEDDHKEEATRKFQTLAKVFFILSDKDKRAVYDETGEVDDERDYPQENDWSSYWRNMFPKITLKEIDEFLEKYKGSEEELEDLKQLYLRYEGDFNKICQMFMGYDIAEESRYRKILTDLIKEKELPDFPIFTKESAARRKARQKKFSKEAKEAEAIKKKLNIGEDGYDSLVNAITKRCREREVACESFLDSLEAKYAKPQTKTRKKNKKS